MAMAFASKGPIQMGRPFLLARSIRRTTKPLDVESKVKNFTLISTYIESLLWQSDDEPITQHGFATTKSLIPFPPSLSPERGERGA
jgi:hypothetical protein